MTFDLAGFDSIPFISAPVGFFGYALMVFYALVTLSTLALNLSDFGRLRLQGWAGFIALALLGVVFAQLSVLHFPANILPPPGLPAETQRPGLALFALIPAFLAGGWLGIGPAVVVGWLTGLSRAIWETRSLATPFEFTLLASSVAWCARQDYRGWPAALLRHPAASGPLVGFIFWPVLYLSYYAYSHTTGLLGWDYVASIVRAAAPVFIGHAAIAGVATELVRMGLPRWWPRRRGALPPPYLSSLNRKLLFTLIPLFLLGIGLLFWADITIATRVSTQLVVDQMGRAAQNAGHEIPFFIQTGRGLVRDIAAQEDWFSGDSLAQTVRLAQSIRALPFFRQLTLFDAGLNPVAGYPTGAEGGFGLTGGEDQFVQQALQGIPQDGAVFSGDSEHPVDILFLAPIVNPATNQPAGALLGRADLVSNPLMQAVTNEFAGLAGGVGQGFILDERGQIIHHPDASYIQQPFEPEASATDLSISVPGARVYQDRAPDGTRRLVLYYPVPGHAWTVVIMVPNQVVLALATQISTPIIVILLLIGMIGLILVSLIAGRVTRPAEALALAAQRISEGQLDLPVSVGGDDEVGRAGMAFEHMRVKLKARLEELGLLLRASQGVASSLNLQDALPPILQGALNATGASGARLVLIPGEELPLPDAPPLHQTFAAGPAAEVMAPLDRGILNLTRNEGRLVIENLARARAILDVAPVAGKLQALLALPLRQEATYYGALWLGYERPHAFTESEVNFLTTLAGQAAVSVANARLFEAAEQRRQRLAAILASTPDAVIVTDRNERVLLLNPAAEAAFELTGKPAIGKPVAQVLPNIALVRLLQDNRAAAGTDEIELSSGRTLYASASPIISADGSVLGRVCVLRDVTHFKELDLMKSEFVATVSHDLRAPLTFMRGYATMLPMVGPLNDKQREFSDKIILGIEQMTKLIDDLLDLGRIEAGVGLAREMCRVDEIVAVVLESLKPEAANKGLTFKVDIPPDLPTLSGDPTLLRQAIANLVDNAVKYTPAGGQVQLAVSMSDDAFQVAVIDSGLGIAPADQAHLFEKFFRVKQRGSTQVKGSGLGLAIVKSIVERHGGRVWVDSKLGKGSAFYLELPRNGVN
ncbi:MAG TPA: ATP-binding protein [Anaerolineales bacterium]|nr:ATP-binding protein [Anaerolineales bacterium]